MKNFIKFIFTVIICAGISIMFIVLNNKYQEPYVREGLKNYKPSKNFVITVD